MDIKESKKPDEREWFCSQKDCKRFPAFNVWEAETGKNGKLIFDQEKGSEQMCKSCIKKMDVVFLSKTGEIIR